MMYKETICFISLFMVINFVTPSPSEDTGNAEVLNSPDDGTTPFPGIVENVMVSNASDDTAFLSNNSSAFSLLPVVLKPVLVQEKTFIIGTFFKANWSRAAKFCTLHQMRLASIKSLLQQESLVEQLQNIDNMRYWTSGNDLKNSAVFVWGDGEAFNYTNWQDGQPDNDNGKKHCVELDNHNGHKFKWNVQNCMQEQYFICEY